MACAHCLKPSPGGGTGLLKCSQCKQVAYCGPKCQRAHWKERHKLECIRLMKGGSGHEEVPTNTKGEACTIPTGSISQQLNSSSSAITSQKKEKPCTSGGEQECANCSSTQSTDGREALQVCTRCKAVSYCGRPCQIQHWKEGGHKQFCVPVEARRVAANNSASDGVEGERSKHLQECPICFEELRPDDTITLPCKHRLHGECVERLRRFSLQQMCPLCRTELPPRPKQVLVESMRTHNQSVTSVRHSTLLRETGRSCFSARLPDCPIPCVPLPARVNRRRHLGLGKHSSRQPGPIVVRT